MSSTNIDRPTDKDSIYMLKGLDLDKKVAEHIFGYADLGVWRDSQDPMIKPLHDEYGPDILIGTLDGTFAVIPRYSSDWNATKLVLEKVHTFGDGIRIEYACMGSGYEEYSAAYVDYDFDGEQEIYKVRANDLGVAVCQAALLKALHYKWDDFKNHYMCPECGVAFHQSRGSDTFTDANNLFEQYPHLRDKAVREYLEAQHKEKEADMKYLDWHQLQPRLTPNDTLIADKAVGVGYLDEFEDKFRECMKTGTVINASDPKKLRAAFIHIDSDGKRTVYSMRLGTMRAVRCRDINRAKELQEYVQEHFGSPHDRLERIVNNIDKMRR